MKRKASQRTAIEIASRSECDFLRTVVTNRKELNNETNGDTNGDTDNDARRVLALMHAIAAHTGGRPNEDMRNQSPERLFTWAIDMLTSARQREDTACRGETMLCAKDVSNEKLRKLADSITNHVVTGQQLLQQTNELMGTRDGNEMGGSV